MNEFGVDIREFAAKRGTVDPFNVLVSKREIYRGFIGWIFVLGRFVLHEKFRKIKRTETDTASQ